MLGAIARTVLPCWVVERLRPLRRRFQSQRGLPPGLDRDKLDAICRGRLGSRLVSVRHLHLSGWKSDSGAFRILVRTADGVERTLVYKDADYSSRAIPALDGLPVTPGLPEYVVYGLQAGALARFLPRVYWRERTQTSYRFLLQDLGPVYLPLSYLQERDSLSVRLATALPGIQASMEESLAPERRQELLQLDRAYSERLVSYAHAALNEYLQRRGSQRVEALLDGWSEVAGTYLDSDHFRGRPVTCVHGDLNPSNVHIGPDFPIDVKLVDWEWAGIGLPHLDLASLLLARPEPVRQQALAAFAARDGRLSSEEHRRHYLWSEMDRSLVTAAYVSKQHVATEGRVGWLPRLVDECAERLVNRARNGLRTVMGP